MTKQYAPSSLGRYLKETPLIRRFLASPENNDLLRMYESVVEEFSSQIIAKRKDYRTFDAMHELFDRFVVQRRDPVLRQHAHKRFTRAMLFYMYWNCDIGETGDATTNLNIRTLTVLSSICR